VEAVGVHPIREQLLCIVIFVDSGFVCGKER
jgi:hypothetical protein